jgi:hypothetical protein
MITTSQLIITAQNYDHVITITSSQLVTKTMTSQLASKFAQIASGVGQNVTFYELTSASLYWVVKRYDHFLNPTATME